ncbi:MAG: hypothetical protein HW421_3057 [Ignavibacteria bacterium]|nr:hypothetical protein [Ignavibacteria bacterium]
MKAYISHCFNENEYYILTILSRELSNLGFVTTNSLGNMRQLYDFQTFSNIVNSNLFIGVITGSGRNNDGVIKDWNFAIKHKIPSVLLIEDNVQIPKNLNHPNIITFNRKNPHDALDKILQRRKESSTIIEQPNKTINALAWLIGGGIALGALISLLSNEDDKKVKKRQTKRKGSHSLPAKVK